MDSLLKGIQHEAGMRGSADAPANDIAGVDIDHEGDIDEARPGRDIGEVGHPEHVRRWSMELPVDVIERARRGLVADRGAHGLATDYPLQAQRAHQPLNGASGHGEAFTVHLPPELPHPVNTEVLGKDAHDLGLQILMTPGTIRQPPWISPLCDTLMVVDGAIGRTLQIASTP